MTRVCTPEAITAVRNRICHMQDTELALVTFEGWKPWIRRPANVRDLWLATALSEIASGYPPNAKWRTDIEPGAAA